MNSTSQTSTSTAKGERINSPQKTLRQLYLTLFLRGNSFQQGLQKESAPGSIGQKLAMTLLLYGLVGLVALALLKMPIFALAVYLHASTFMFLAMFLASSMGAVLFNKEEADILLHRPIGPEDLLKAKIRVLFDVSIWIAAAFNLTGFAVGFMAHDGGWRFVLAHILSLGLEAAFCAGCVVMVYQLCLRWCGRERLDGVLTTTQVLLVIVAIVGSQLLPQLARQDKAGLVIDKHSWWIVLIPPAWFAGLDDVVSSSFEWKSALLAVLAVVSTALVLWISFDRLVSDYGAGLQKLGESVGTKPRTKSGRKWIDVAIGSPPLRWVLRDPITRASFQLVAAYLVRDRDVKLRLYPAIAPMMVMPIMMFFQKHSEHDPYHGVFAIGLVGSYLCLAPVLGISLIQYSQQWQASEVFRAAPLAGPSAICDGARWAILCCLTAPAYVVFTLAAWILQGNASNLPLLLPGMIALPVFGLFPNIGGACIPLSRPVEESRAAMRGLTPVAALIPSFVLSGIAGWAWYTDWFHWFILGEIIAVACLYVALRHQQAEMKWPTP